MDFPSESASWAWGVSLIGATMTVHAIGVVFMAFGMNGIHRRLEALRLGPRRILPIVIALVAMIGLALTALHGLEAAIWAAAYLRIGAFGSLSDAVLFSLGAMTTVGAPGMALPRSAQIMGVLEAANGALLFGISTAYVFGVMQAYWPLLHPSVAARDAPSPGRAV